MHIYLNLIHLKQIHTHCCNSARFNIILYEDKKLGYHKKHTHKLKGIPPELPGWERDSRCIVIFS